MITMQLEKSLIGIGTSLLELYLLKNIYGIFWQNKNYSIVHRIVYSFVFVSIWFFIEPISNHPAHFLCGWGLHLLYARFYQVRLRDQFLFSFTTLLVMLSVEYTVGFILAHLFGNNFEVLLNTNILFYLCGAVSSKMILFIMVKGFQFLFQRQLKGLSINGILPIILLPVTSVITGFTIMQISPIISKENMDLPVATIFLLLTCSGLYFIHVTEKQAVQEQAAQRLQFIEEQHSLQINHCKELDEDLKKIRETKHDMKNTLTAISGIIKNGEIEKALGRITVVCDEIDAANSIVQTGVYSLDAVLSAKISKATKLHIKISYQISIANLYIDELEFSVLIANALDNAIEACSRIKDMQNPLIDLRIHESGSYILVNVENTSPVPDKLKTWKKNPENHGLGLESMQRTIDKYDGHVDHHYSGGIFYLSILMKNK